MGFKSDDQRKAFFAKLDRGGRTHSSRAAIREVELLSKKSGLDTFDAASILHDSGFVAVPNSVRGVTSNGVSDRFGSIDYESSETGEKVRLQIEDGRVVRIDNLGKGGKGKEMNFFPIHDWKFVESKVELDNPLPKPGSSLIDYDQTTLDFARMREKLNRVLIEHPHFNEQQAWRYVLDNELSAKAEREQRQELDLERIRNEHRGRLALDNPATPYGRYEVPANAPAFDGMVHRATGTIVWDEPGSIPRDLSRFRRITTMLPGPMPSPLTVDNPITPELVTLAQMIASGPITEAGKLALKAYILRRTVNPDILNAALLL